MKPKRIKNEDGSISETTRIGKPKTFPGIVQECVLAMNMSYGAGTQDDGNGNPVTVFLWMNGDWKIEYKGKEYIMSLNKNVSALIDWINSQEKTK